MTGSHLVFRLGGLFHGLVPLMVATRKKWLPPEKTRLFTFLRFVNSPRLIKVTEDGGWGRLSCRRKKMASRGFRSELGDFSG